MNQSSTKLRSRVWTPLIAIIIFILGIGIGAFIQPFINLSKPLDKYIEREDPIDEIISLVNQEYVDEISRDSLYIDAVNGILSRLDPHTIYIPSSQVLQANQIIEGNGKGIGIDYFFMNDSLLVTGLEKDGPSDKAGIKIGDRIVAVNGKIIAGAGATESMAVNAFRQSRSDSLTLSVQRPSYNKILSLNLKKDILHYNSVTSAYMLDQNVGYIKMDVFSMESYNDFSKALENLLSKNMKSLIFDLRGNGGGVLTEAVSIADEFINDEKLIVFTENKKYGKDEYNASINGIFEKGRLVILIDNNSASASEIIAGAVQDWDRGVIVGKKSFGKGLIQEQYELSDGSAIRITTGRYYTPTGRSIQRPYESGKYDEYYKNEDNITSKLKLYHSFLKKRPLYGSGGITPDFETKDSSVYLNVMELLEKRHLETFSNQYFFKIAKDTIANINVNNYVSNYKVDDHIMNAFKEYLLKNDAMLINQTWKNPNNIEFIRKYIKAHFAKLAFGNEAYYQVMNKRDNDITSALKIINSDEYDKMLSIN